MITAAVRYAFWIAGCTPSPEGAADDPMSIPKRKLITIDAIRYMRCFGPPHA